MITIESAQTALTDAGVDYLSEQELQQMVDDANRQGPQSSYKTPEALFDCWVRQMVYESNCETKEAIRNEGPVDFE